MLANEAVFSLTLKKKSENNQYSLNLKSTLKEFDFTECLMPSSLFVDLFINNLN